ncbi:MAG TPA: hypothetical protein DCP74_05795 [Bacteroidales bacterium]|nr:hypothetical protein [Bacteroidales bacterium]
MKYNRLQLILILTIICSGCSPKPDCNRMASVIEEEFNSGNFYRVLNLADSIKENCKADPVLITKADSLADMAQRIKLDFTLSEEEAIKLMEARIGPFSMEEKSAWEEKGWLEYRIIDGEKRYFNRTVSNLGLLKLFHEDKQGWLKENAVDPALVFRLRHTGDVIKSAENNNDPLVPVKMKVDYTLTVDADAVPDGEVIRCWLPWPKSTHPRQKQVDLIDISSHEFTFAPDTAIHGTIYMEATAIKGTPTVFKVSFRYQSSAAYFNPENIEPLPYDRYSRLHLKYTSEQPPQITFSDNLRKLTDSIAVNEENPVIVVRKIYSWFKENIPWTGALEYSTMPDIPEYVIRNRRGDCGMQTFLFMSMLRYKGIPVRWQSGWMVPEIGKNLHDWCEIYYEGTGWIPEDISYDLQASENTALKNFFMSGVDSYRMILNEGIAGRLHPPKKFPRSEPYDFQRGEVEWSGGNLYFDRWDYSMKIEYLE